MEKYKLYQAALDSCVFIRQFMFQENHYFMSLDFALQPLIEDLQDSMKDMLPKPKSVDKAEE